MAMISKAISTVTSSGLNIGDAINVAVGASDYKQAREEGDSRGKAIIKAGASFAWGEFFYGGVSSAVGGAVKKAGLGAIAGGAVTMGATVGLMMVPAIASLIGVAAENGSKARTQSWTKAGYFGSGQFNMSEAGYTMRQRSLNAIRQNGLNTRSVLGNEARTYYRG